jgi:effector-binding domain-containing protein
MGKMKVWFVLLLLVCLTITAVRICAESPKDQSAFTIREVEPQVVLYTIHRGSYEQAGKAIGKLYELAGRKGIPPCGWAFFVYLNNPQNVSSEHWLTEIRIPVAKDALRLTGTLGKMTDVKELPAIKVAVAVKQIGQADPGYVYKNLGAWILKQNYIAVGSPCEKFLTNAATGNYADMKSEIMIPIRKHQVNSP